MLKSLRDEYRFSILETSQIFKGCKFCILDVFNHRCRDMQFVYFRIDENFSSSKKAVAQMKRMGRCTWMPELPPSAEPDVCWSLLCHRGNKKKRWSTRSRCWWWRTTNCHSNAQRYVSECAIILAVVHTALSPDMRSLEDFDMLT